MFLDEFRRARSGFKFYLENHLIRIFANPKNVPDPVDIHYSQTIFCVKEATSAEQK
jgi:hypothetical protein